MRILPWCWIGVAFTLAGCYANPYSSNPEVKTKVSAQECKDDDCCSSVTRAGMLKKSAESKQKPAESESKSPE